jgi:putative phosphoribosyl transferase
VRKLGVPWQPELAMGALGEGGVLVVDQRTMQLAGVDDEALRGVEARERDVLADRVRAWRAVRPRADVSGRTCLVVDDGIATGSTARAACRVLRAAGAARIVLAAPVAPRDVVDSIPEADDVVVLETPRDFTAVGAWYDDFSATSDDEVVALLRELGAGDGDAREGRVRTALVGEGHPHRRRWGRR